MGRKKGVKLKEPYFGEREEQAVMDYLLGDSETKNQIYNLILKKAFKKMIPSILKRYRNYIGNHDIVELEMDGLSFLIENMHKYNKFLIEYRRINSEDDWEKHKHFKYKTELEQLKKLNEIQGSIEFEYRTCIASAYSYYGTIVRNYFRHRSKDARKEVIENLDFEVFIDEVETRYDYAYEMDTSDQQEEDENKFFNSVVDQIRLEIKTNTLLKKNEIIVGEAIISILFNWKTLFNEEITEDNDGKQSTSNFRKNKMLLLLKEQTRLTTKDIRDSIKNYKSIYYLTKKMINMDNE
jgi:hypothetical protein